MSLKKYVFCPEKIEKGGWENRFESLLKYVKQPWNTERIAYFC